MLIGMAFLFPTPPPKRKIEFEYVGARENQTMVGATCMRRSCKWGHAGHKMPARVLQGLKLYPAIFWGTLEYVHLDESIYTGNNEFRKPIGVIAD